MKKIIYIALLFAGPLQAQEPAYVRSVFANSRMPGYYFYSKGHASGGSSIRLINEKLPVDATRFHSPGNSLLLSYSNVPGGNWQAQLLVTETRGQDHFKPATHLSFFVSSNGQPIPDSELPAVSLLNEKGQRSAAANFRMSAPKGWSRVLIPIEAFWNDSVKQVGQVAAIVFSQRGRIRGSYQISVDDVEWVTPAESTAPLAPLLAPTAIGYPRHIDLSWKLPEDTSIRYVQISRASNTDSVWRPIGVQLPHIARYADYVGKSDQTYRYAISYLDASYRSTANSPAVEAHTRELDDDAFLDMIQEAHFRYYWEGAERVSGLALENISGRRSMIASGASGFGIMALLAGTERKFITRQQAVDRFVKIVNFLEQAETFHGAFPHFIDGPTGKAVPFFGRRDNGGDLVETSFLLQGLLAAEQYFQGEAVEEKLIRDKIKKIWERVEWDWYRRYPDSRYLYWHWSPDQGWVINHRLIGWNETMITYLLAIFSPTHSVPADLYYTGWASQDSIAQQYRINWGGTSDGSNYRNGNTYEGIPLKVGVSNGGPLFFTHYSFMGLDPHAVNDKYTNYFDNNQSIALINYRYCVRNPEHHRGYSDSCWGLTASDGPFHYSADEPVERQDDGKIAPTGAVSSFPYTPAESMKALRNYYYQFGSFLWGEYGFRDAFNLDQNWCSEIYMGLNQAPMVVMIENYRSGLLWKLFMSHESVQAGIKKFNQITKNNP